MKKVAFIVSHLGSGSNYLVNILNNNPRCMIFNSNSMYEHPDSLSWLFKNHKLKGFSGAIYGDHLLYNHSFSCKKLYDYCKFIYLIRPARQSLNEIYHTTEYSKKNIVNYYRYRLRRICEMAKKTKNSILLTYDELISNKNFGIIEDYLGLIHPLVDQEFDGEVDFSSKENVFEEETVRSTEDCYEKYFYYLNNLGLKRP
jgi:hypothetical protein